jgi:predicted flap endonuclease-1-like 5' DNA nuclease
MFYLIETCWIWFVVAFIAGAAVGYFTSSTKDPLLHGFSGWLRWVAIAFVIGLIVAISGRLPDRAGFYLETLLGVVFSYVVGSLVAGLLRKAWSLIEGATAPSTVLASEAPAPTIEGPSGVTEAAGVEPVKPVDDARRAAEAKASEDARRAADAKAADDARQATEAKASDDARRAAEAKAADDARRAAEAEAADDARRVAEAKAADDARRVAEAKAADDARRVAEAKAVDDGRRVAEAKAADDARRVADAKAADDARQAAEAKAADDARQAAEAKAADDARRAADVKAVEDARRAADAKTAAPAGRRATTTRIGGEVRRPAVAETRRAASAKNGRRVAEAKATDEAREAVHAKAAEEVRRAADAEAAAEARRAADERARQAVHARAAEELHRAADADSRRTADAESRRAAAEAARQAVHAQAAKEVYRAADAEAAAEARRSADAKAAAGHRLTETKPKEAQRPASSKPAQAPRPAARSADPSSGKAAPPVASGVPSKPVGIDAPLNGKPDDLKLIKGVGAKNEKICNDLGVYHFGQIADWSSDEAAWIGQHMASPGRVEREHWIPQAKLLAAGGDTEHSTGVKAGTIALDEWADAPLDEAQTATLQEWLPEQAAPVENETRYAGRRPYGLRAPRDGRRDNLKRIRGIGPQNENRLNAIGIWHYTQIAAWSSENVKWIASYLAASGRIEREKWIDQAKELAAGGGAEVSRGTTSGKNSARKTDNARPDSQIVEPHKEG